jgi:hypothetical protein
MAARKQTNPMPFPVALIFTTIGAALLVVLLWAFVGPRLWSALVYRPTTATVVDKRLGVVRGKGIRYALKVQLAYQVEGEDREAWVSLPRTTRQKEGLEAEAVLGQLAVGEEVDCYYDPFRHSASVVLDKPNLEWGMAYAVLFPCLFLLVGIVGMASSWRRTFPRGVAVATAELFRRLPWRFYAATAGLLLIVGGCWLTLWARSVALGGLALLVILAAIGGGIAVGSLALRYGAVALSSPEQRAVRSREAEATPGPGLTVPPDGSWNLAEPVATDRGARLPVRLRPDLFGDAVVGGCLLGLIPAIALIVLTGPLLRRWREEAPPGLARMAPAGAIILVGAVVGLLLTWRLMRRQGRLTIELSDHPLRTGQSYRLAVSYPDPVVLRRAWLELVAEEGSGQGKGSSQHKAIRQPIVLDAPTDLGETRHGRLQVPANAPASFKLPHHQIKWYLTAGVGRWYRWKVRYPVAVVRPAPEEAPPLSARPQPLRLDDGPVALWIDRKTVVVPPRATLTGGYTIRPADTGPLRSAELSVLWYTAAPGHTEMGVYCYQEHTAFDGNDQALYGHRSFHAQLPDGPFSYEGKVVKIRWAVRLRLRYVSGEERVRELPFYLGAVGAGGTT